MKMPLIIKKTAFTIMKTTPNIMEPHLSIMKTYHIIMKTTPIIMENSFFHHENSSNNKTSHVIIKTPPITMKTARTIMKTAPSREQHASSEKRSHIHENHLQKLAPRPWQEHFGWVKKFAQAINNSKKYQAPSQKVQIQFLDIQKNSSREAIPLKQLRTSNPLFFSHLYSCIAVIRGHDPILGEHKVDWITGLPPR